MADEDFKGVMQQMAESTGLPKGAWPTRPPRQHVTSATRFRHMPTDSGEPEHTFLDYDMGLTIPEMIVGAVKDLPVAHVIGQSVLVRLPSGVTTMTTIAEAACGIFGSDLAELLWMILQALKNCMRPMDEDHKTVQCRYNLSERNDCVELSRYRWRKGFLIRGKAISQPLMSKR